MATTEKIPIQEWKTFHDNGPYPSRWFQRTKLVSRFEMGSSRDRYNDAALEIQRLIREASDSGEGFRALGSTWSLSNIAHHPDRMHDNSWMKLRFDIRPQDVHHLSPYRHTNLFCFQCGNKIKQISEYIFRKGKSLKTSGASNGQSIAGCISTGVHGSGLDIGSIQDYVVGINLIIGPDPEDNVYLERHSRPVLTDVFIHQFNARIIRNDDLFNAALVGLGAFGYIHGVVIEVEDLFLLKRYVKKIDRELALRLAETMQFDETRSFLPQEVDVLGNGLRPFHYKIFINPYSDEEDFVVECIYKKSYRESYPNPIPRIQKAIYTDLITLFTKVVQRFPNTIPKLIRQLSKSGAKIMPRVDSQTTGTLAQTFWDTQHQGPAFACSVGIDISDCRRALDLLTEMTRAHPIPGIYAMRFVKQSEATLAFTRFPITCMLEIDGILWEGTKHIISLEEYAKKMLDVLEDNAIPYTLHWGKNAQWDRPGLVRQMYGDNMDKWIKHRSALLSPEMAEVFSSPFLKTVGLDKYAPDVPADIIASRDIHGDPVV